jgi:glyoxylase-like metal-dependent hydrolase (beta-lactamase superfamily II)
VITAAELHYPAPRCALWHAFDPAVKSELFSTAISTADGTWFVDPIPLPGSALEELLATGPARGIIVTNQNHWRASSQLAGQLSVPIFAREDTQNSETAVEVTPITDGMRLGDSLEVMTIEGAAPGEVVLYSAANAGTMIVGDALINFEPYGFTFLPRKYCANQKIMRRFLGKLLDRQTERIFFAHGLPILSSAGARLRELIKPGSEP